jgi:hypothetical protein
LVEPLGSTEESAPNSCQASGAPKGGATPQETEWQKRKKKARTSSLEDQKAFVIKPRRSGSKPLRTVSTPSSSHIAWIHHHTSDGDLDNLQEEERRHQEVSPIPTEFEGQLSGEGVDRIQLSSGNLSTKPEDLQRRGNRAAPR